MQPSGSVNSQVPFSLFGTHQSPYSRPLLPPTPFGAAGSRGSSLTCQRLGKEEIRVQIEQKNKVLQDLQSNKKFFDEVLDSKTKEFEARLKEINPQVFDKIFKTTLHYIYKHYENFKNGLSPEEAGRILAVNLSHQKSEVDRLKSLYTELSLSNDSSVNRLKDLAVKGGVIRGGAESFERTTREEMEAKIKGIERENSQLDSKASEIRKLKDNELIQLHLEMERKGRNKMEKRAIELASEFARGNPEWESLRSNIEALLQDIEAKRSAKKSNPYYQLLKKKQQLQKQLAVNKIIES